MRSGWLITARSLLLSVFIHVVLFGLLVFGTNQVSIPKPPPKADFIKAVSIDKKLVESELQKIKDAERKKTEEAKKKREQEEKSLQDLARKKLEESRKLKQEQRRLKELEAKRKIEEKKEKAAEERRKLEEKKKREAEQKRRQEEEELRRLEEKKKLRQKELERQQKEERRRRDEELMQQQLLEEETVLERVQEQQDRAVIDQYIDRIKRLVAREFNTAGLPKGLSCKISIRLIPSGSVANVRIIVSSGNRIFDNRALIAVEKVSPLPVPDDMRLFEKMREIRFTFLPEN